jgi:hypothetical protein
MATFLSPDLPGGLGAGFNIFLFLVLKKAAFS